jgi:hypothetical protein
MFSALLHCLLCIESYLRFLAFDSSTSLSMICSCHFTAISSGGVDNEPDIPHHIKGGDIY